MADAERGSPEAQQRRRRRRSVALAILLAALAALFYIMALVQGPGVLERAI